MRIRCGLAAGIALAVSACGTGRNLGVEATAFPAVAAQAQARASVPVSEEYRIGPRDVLMISVFNEPGLTFDELHVSSGGTISLPLIGTVRAAGRTAAELASEIDTRLNERYLRSARTAVSVAEATNFTVVVDGAVNEPGIFPIPGHIMLSQSLALAGGAAQFARLDEVVVIRDIDGQRYAARFDVRDIQAGRAPDFALEQSDTVIVGFNYAASLFRDILITLPSAAAVFAAVR